MQVSVLLLVSVAVRGAQQLLEPPQARNSEDGEAALAAEGLEQGEVDLQSHVVCIVGRQNAQDHAVGVSEEPTGKHVRHSPARYSGRKRLHALAFTYAFRSLADS